jgi:O-antigen ligase
LLLDFLTASRATLALAGGGMAATLLFSCAKGMTGRKGAVLVLLLLVSAIVGPLAWQSMRERRGAEGVESSNSERAAFKRAAWMIIGDYPFGIGPNQYVVVANVGGYSQRAGVNWNSGSRATSVHNSYLLVWAETGLIGFVTMLFLLWSPVLSGLRMAYRYRRNPKSEVLLGFSVALLVFGVHLLFEWAWVLFIAQYMFAIYAGATVGMIAELRGEAAPAYKRRAPPMSISMPGAEALGRSEPA